MIVLLSLFLFACSFFAMFIFKGILTKILFVLLCAILGVLSTLGGRRSRTHNIDRNVNDLTMMEKIKFYRNKN